MFIISGGLMKKAKINVENEKVVLAFNEESEVIEVYLWHWLAAYFLNYIVENNYATIKNKGIQDAVEEYSFAINNADDINDVIIPELILGDIKTVGEILTSQKKEVVDFSFGVFDVSESSYKSIFDVIYDDFLQSHFNEISGYEIELQVDESYGKKFYEYLANRFITNDNLITEIPTNICKKDIRVIYENQLIYDFGSNYDEIREVSINGAMSGCLVFRISIEDGENIDGKMYFPIWNQGDTIEISIEYENEQLVIYGKHLNTGVLTKAVF